MPTPVESTVRVTTRQSDRAPIASEAATASVSRGEATGAERPSKPAAPGDRIMVQILRGAGESLPRERRLFAAIAGKIAAGTGRKTAK